MGDVRGGWVCGQEVGRGLPLRAFATQRGLSLSVSSPLQSCSIAPRFQQKGKYTNIYINISNK